MKAVILSLFAAFLLSANAIAQIEIQHARGDIYVNADQKRSVVEFETNYEGRYRLESFTIMIHRIWSNEDLDVEDLIVSQNLIQDIVLVHGERFEFAAENEGTDINQFENMTAGDLNDNCGVSKNFQAAGHLAEGRQSWRLQVYFAEEMSIDAFEFDIFFDEWVDDNGNNLNCDPITLAGPNVIVVENYLYLNTDVFIDGTNEVAVLMQSGAQVSGIQFDLVLNEPLDRLPIREIASQKEDFILEWEQRDANTVRIIFFSPNGATIEPGWENPFNIWFDARELEPGNQVSAEITNPLIFGPWRSRPEFSFSGFSTVRGQLADLDVNFQVNIADILFGVEISLNGIFGPFVRWAGDLDDNGEINIRDVMMIVDTAMVWDANNVPSGPFIDDQQPQRDNNWQWEFSNDEALRAFQIDLHGDLAESEATLIPDRCSSMTLSQSWNEDGGFRRIIVWGLNNIIGPGEGPLFEINNSPEEVEVGEPILVFANPEGIEIEAQTPINFEVFPAYPNPFNGMTTISFVLPQSAWTEAAIFDLSGRKISTLIKDQLPAGKQCTTIDASALAGSQYFLRLQTPFGVRTQTLTLIK